MSTRSNVKEFIPISKTDPILSDLRRLFTSSFYEYYQTVESQLNLPSNTTLKEWLDGAFDDEVKELLAHQCRCFLIYSPPPSSSIAGLLTVKENEKDAQSLYLSQLAVDPVLKRKGYGLLLLKHLVQVFPSTKTYTCLCRRVNIPALHFYTKHGAQVLDDDQIATKYGYNPVDYLGFQLNSDQLQAL